MFAQPLKSLPLRGGKKTASSLAPQATDEGGWSVSNKKGVTRWAGCCVVHAGFVRLG